MFKSGLGCGAFETLVRLRGQDPTGKFLVSPLNPEVRVEAELLTSTGKQLGPEWHG
jgi:hypothetical protein